ncbi:MAG TPA: Stp1/IreP family PP2C-type Ser/Thr phosphatase [Clostridiales bacterium]|nr:Stp1/IreP family PP2C-type Ser/Thr phosphatase [Clostridiales bacterium]
MLSIYAGSDTGRVRKTNQDYYDYKILGEELAFAVLCDGMGGQNGGHVAAEKATGFVAEALARDLRSGMTESSLRNVMQSAIAGANALVYDIACKDAKLAGMGTTLIAAVFDAGHVFIASVGDSRAYYIPASGEEVQLTKDHTVVQMLLDIGEIDREQAQRHPQRHYITRAVGVASTVEADYLEHPIQPGDMILLCSDGLYHYVEAGSLANLVRESVAAKSVDNLINLANQAGGADNISAVVMCWESGDIAGTRPQQQAADRGGELSGS